MKLPTQEECKILWDKYGVLPNIREHVTQVARVAGAVAAHIEKHGAPVNRELVNRGALLHDIAKTITLQKGGSHSKLGREIVLQEGYDERLGNIILKHGLNIFGVGLTLEEQIVNYSDKRVRHEKIVSLHERMGDLKMRYPDSAQAIDAKLPLYREFEERYELHKIGGIVS